MAESDYNADLVLRVMGRHAVGVHDLARASGIAPGMISRYTSGQYPVTLALYAALWRLTRDADLLACLGDDVVHVAQPVTPRDDQEALDVALSAHHGLVGSVTRYYMARHGGARAAIAPGAVQTGQHVEDAAARVIAATVALRELVRRHASASSAPRTEVIA